MKLKQFVRALTVTVLSLFIGYSCFYFFTHDVKPTHKECGVVMSKSNDEVAIKHGSRTELYLNVQFEQSGFKSVECEPTLYFSKSVGDNVCFYLNDPTDVWHMVYCLTAMVSITMAGIVLLVLFVNYLF